MFLSTGFHAVKIVHYILPCNHQNNLNHTYSAVVASKATVSYYGPDG